MKKVYIAHPLRRGTRDMAEIGKNIARVTEICRSVSWQHPNVLVLSPIHAFGFVSPLEPQEWVLSQCRALLEMADELWVFGDWQNSEGCRMEVEHARKMGITVVFEDGRGEAQCQGFDA